MEKKFRNQRINNYLDDNLIVQLTAALQPLGAKGFKRVCDMYELLILGIDIDGIVPMETLHWDQLQEEDQELMAGMIGTISPLLDIYLQLSPARRKKIKDAVRANLHGGRK